MLNKCFTLQETIAIIIIAPQKILSINYYNKKDTCKPDFQKAGEYMPSGADIIKDYITEFSRLQDWMIPIKEVAPDTYLSMYRRYIELKVTLSSLGVSLAELDRIKE